jgi:sphinganine-1-phosphate aldolase
MAIADAMFQKGWVSSRTGRPPAIHLMLSPAHLDVTDAYLADLAAATAAAGPAPGGGAAGQYA